MTQCNICNWPNSSSPEPLIFETRYWRVLIAPNQSLLGRCYVNLRRHEGRMSSLHPLEIDDWLTVVKRLEASVAMAFDAVMFNWQCNLNFAYRDDPPNPHVHWHFMPRYDKPVKLLGYDFHDPDFGSLYQPRNQLLPFETLAQIAYEINSHAQSLQDL